MLDLPEIRLTGTPAQMGRQYGDACTALIRRFVEQRLRAARAYLWERGHRGLDPLLSIGQRSLDQLEAWDNDGWVEFRATATAAGVDPVHLHVAGNMTDLRDVIAAPAADAEGCTTALVPAQRSRDGIVIAGQTWDLNPPDLEYVVAVHRRPERGPATWSVTVAGCPSLVGMNEHGVAVGTTNIKVRGNRPGIPYLNLLHRMVQQPDREAALAVVANAPRAAAHTYWAADTGGVADLECSADRCVRRDAGPAALCRTNHCLDGEHAVREAEAATASSQARLRRMTAWLAERPQDVASIKAIFADRRDGVDSINRFPEDDQGTSTNACLVAVPALRELHACRGPADRGEWTVLRFA